MRQRIRRAISRSLATVNSGRVWLHRVCDRCWVCLVVCSIVFLFHRLPLPAHTLAQIHLWIVTKKDSSAMQRSSTNVSGSAAAVLFVLLSILGAANIGKFMLWRMTTTTTTRGSSEYVQILCASAIRFVERERCVPHYCEPCINRIAAVAPSRRRLLGTRLRSGGLNMSLRHATAQPAVYTLRLNMCWLEWVCKKQAKRSERFYEEKKKPALWFVLIIWNIFARCTARSFQGCACCFIVFTRWRAQEQVQVLYAKPQNCNSLLKHSNVNKAQVQEMIYHEKSARVRHLWKLTYTRDNDDNAELRHCRVGMSFVQFLRRLSRVFFPSSLCIVCAFGLV